ncbi:MAG: hypothetical protein RMI79_06530 [Nitrososphaerota archaeon]|nr:hypothetical protein [Nitrososphaerota archaeon]
MRLELSERRLKRGGKPRILKLSSRLLNMLNALKAESTSDRIFSKNLMTLRGGFRIQGCCRYISTHLGIGDNTTFIYDIDRP